MMIRNFIWQLARYIINKRYKRMGFIMHPTSVISAHYIKKTGGGGKIFLHANSQINAGCFFLSADNITIGENTAIAYNVTFLTSANPNYPHNLLSRIYPPLHAPIKIGNNCWIGANSIILPGVTIGNNCVVAAGSVVNRNLPDNVMAAGTPAKIKKHITISGL